MYDISSGSPLLALISLLISVVLGFGIMAAGQVLLAIREIALNTRKNDQQENKRLTDYAALLTMSLLYKYLGWVVIILGLVAAVLIAR